MKTFRVAIDGPVGAGKSSLASELSKRLDIQYLDTGALYRALAYYFVTKGVVPSEDGNYSESSIKKIEKELPDVFLESKFIVSETEPFFIGPLPDPHIFVNGADVNDVIRTPEISKLSSKISALPIIREYLLDFQRDYAEKYSVVMEGRDIATIVLPDADAKIFITASPEIRAQRRFKELQGKNVDTTYETVLAELIARDKADSEREVAPLKPAEGSSILDTSRYSFAQSAYVLEVITRAYLRDYEKAVQAELDELEASRKELEEGKAESENDENSQSINSEEEK